MLALEEFRKYLINTPEPFAIYTDHANLQYFRKPQDLNRRQARWLTQLQEFHFTLHHIAGKLNSKADLLSRRPGYDHGDNDNEDLVLLDSTRFHTLQVQALYDLPANPYDGEIRKSRLSLEPTVRQALERHESDWDDDKNGLLTYRRRTYVPVNRPLREKIIHDAHDTPLAGHPGCYKTAELILHEYWWPRLQQDVRKYVEGCETCQRTKPHRTPLSTPLHLFDPPSRPWEVITFDLIGPLPESQGHNVILVIVDWFSKAGKFVPTNLELTAEGFAKLLRDHVFRDHGLPL